MSQEKPYTPSNEEIQKAGDTMTQLQKEASDYYRGFSPHYYEQYVKEFNVSISPEERDEFINSVQWNPETRHLTFSLRGKNVDMRYYETTQWNDPDTKGAYEATVNGTTISTEAAEKLKGLYHVALFGVAEYKENELHNKRMKEEREEWKKSDYYDTQGNKIPAFLTPSEEDLKKSEKDINRAPTLDTNNDHLINDLLSSNS